MVNMRILKLMKLVVPGLWCFLEAIDSLTKLTHIRWKSWINKTYIMLHSRFCLVYITYTNVLIMRKLFRWDLMNLNLLHHIILSKAQSQHFMLVNITIIILFSLKIFLHSIRFCVGIIGTNFDVYFEQGHHIP